MQLRATWGDRVGLADNSVGLALNDFVRCRDWAIVVAEKEIRKVVDSSASAPGRPGLL